jgi:glutathione S-transferase
MDPILFYGVPEGCSFGSIVALEWTGRPYKLCRIQMPEIVTSEDYRRINPVGETPSLMTGSGEIVSESVAILNHIAAGVVEKGIGFTQGTAEFDRLNAMLAFLNTSFFNAFSPLEHGSAGAEKDTLQTYGRIKVAKAHADLEAMVEGREWLLGNSRTLADAYFIGIARWADFHDAIDRRNYPGLQRLYERLEDDAAVRFAHAIEHEDRAESTGRFAGHVTLDEALRLHA